MIPRSAAVGQEVNSRNADEVFTEDGSLYRHSWYEEVKTTKQETVCLAMIIEGQLPLPPAARAFQETHAIRR